MSIRVHPIGESFKLFAVTTSILIGGLSCSSGNIQSKEEWPDASDAGDDGAIADTANDSDGADTQKMTLIGTFFRDLNRDGVRQEPQEIGWGRGFRVAVLDANQEVLARRTSNQIGMFEIKGLPLGPAGSFYTVAVESGPDNLQLTTLASQSVPADQTDQQVFFGSDYHDNMLFYEFRPDWVWPKGTPATPRRAELNQKREPVYYVMNDQTNMWNCAQGTIARPPIDWTQISNFNPPPCLRLYRTTIDCDTNCNDMSCCRQVGWPDHGEINGWGIFGWNQLAPVSSAEQIFDYKKYYKGALDQHLKGYLDKLPAGKRAAISVYTLSGDGPWVDNTPDGIKSIAPSRTLASSCGQAPKHNDPIWMKHYAGFVRELMRYVQDELSEEERQKIAAWWVATGFYGETIITAGGCQIDAPIFNAWLLAHTMEKQSLWYNYGDSPQNCADVVSLNQTPNCQNPEGSMLSPLAVWERWVGGNQEVWIMATAPSNAFAMAEFCKGAEVFSPRGPLGLKQHGWSSDVGTHHTGTETEKRTDSWGQADIWVDLGDKTIADKFYDRKGQLFNPATIHPGGYGQFMLGGLEHAYAENKHDTYWSWLFSAAMGATQYDTMEKFYDVGHNLGATLYAADHWQFVRRYAHRNHLSWVGTFRLIRFGRTDYRKVTNKLYDHAFYNDQPNDDRNDWVRRVSDYHHNDLVIVNQASNPITRAASANDSNSPPADLLYQNAPEQLRKKSTSYPNYFYGWQSIGILNLTTSGVNTLEIKPFYAPDGVPSSQLMEGDPVEAMVVLANFRHAFRLGYGDTWSDELPAQPADGTWTIIKIQDVTYHPDKLLRLQVTADQHPDKKDYIHLIIFQKPWGANGNLDWSDHVY